MNILKKRFSESCVLIYAFLPWAAVAPSTAANEPSLDLSNVRVFFSNRQAKAEKLHINRDDYMF